MQVLEIALAVSLQGGNFTIAQLSPPRPLRIWLESASGAVLTLVPQESELKQATASFASKSIQITPFQYIRNCFTSKYWI
jgi:hypothetical protein